MTLKQIVDNYSPGGQADTKKYMNIGKNEAQHWQRKLRPGMNPGAAFMHEDMDAYKASREASAKAPLNAKLEKQPFPTAYYDHGNFFDEDDEDTWMETYTEIEPGGQGKKKYGTFMADADRIVKYHQRKKDVAAYMDELRHANFLVDPTDPVTYDEVFKLYPELKEVPRRWYNDMIGLQYALHTVLQRGRITSREDHALIMWICRPSFELPYYPIWDPHGLLLKTTGAFKGMEEYWKLNTIGKEKAMFNPFQWGDKGFGIRKGAKDGLEGTVTHGKGIGADKGEVTLESWIQEDIKIGIIKRLYKRFADKSDAYVKKKFFRGLITDPSSYFDAEPVVENADMYKEVRKYLP